MAAGRRIALDPDRLWSVLEGLRRGERNTRPTSARLVMLFLRHLCPDTGAVLLTREEMAQRVGVTVQGVSVALSQLVQAGVIRRHHQSPGRRGGACVFIFLDPDIAWSGSEDARARARWPGSLASSCVGEASPLSTGLG